MRFAFSIPGKRGVGRHCGAITDMKTTNFQHGALHVVVRARLDAYGPNIRSAHPDWSTRLRRSRSDAFWERTP